MPEPTVEPLVSYRRLQVRTYSNVRLLVLI